MATFTAATTATRASRTPAGIEHVDTRLVRVPVDPPRGDAIQKFTALELPIVTVTDGDGHTGIGFGYTIGTGGHAILTLLRAELVPQLTGMDSRRIAFIHDRLLRSIHALTPGCLASTALAAIDVALWDLAGRRTSTPLWKLLGGARQRVPVYNTHVGWLDRPVDEMVALCREAVERDGFRALKLKVGKQDPAEDVERVARVRQAVGNKTKLMIDANQSWSVDEAIRRLPLLEPYDLVWIEEPLPATDIDGFVRLGQHTSIPRAGGESLYDPAYFADCARRGALDIFQPDVARVGGITSALEVCQLAAAFGLPVAPHVSPELSVTVAAAVPNSMFIEFIPQMEPILARTVRIEDGYAVPSDAPGHGIEFDAAALDGYDVTAPVRER
jgi:L-alanine-DL-glutamate epimerase-like enolase superfamily enzyme